MDIQEPSTRQERRQLKRQEQRGGQSHQRRNRLLRRVGLWGLTVLVLGGVGWGMVKLADRVQLPTNDGTLAVAVSASDHVRGVDNATITLVEYGDFQCPACAAYEPIVQELSREPVLKDTLRVVFRHLPLTQIHQNAQIAAQAAEAAGLQGKFWEMHDALYATQNKWSAMSDTGAREAFAGYAREIGIDANRFGDDIDSSTVKDRIKADVSGAEAANVSSTPTFFVNGVKTAQPQSYEQFKQFVLAGAVTPTPTPTP